MTPRRRRVLCLLAVLAVLAECARTDAQLRPNQSLVEKRVKHLGPLPFDKDINYVTLSPTGERLAYRLRHKKKDYLISDGKPGKPYNAAEWPAFSPDGRRLVYLAHRRGVEGQEDVVVCDGQEGARGYDSCTWNFGSTSPFSPDSQRLAYCARRPVRGNQARVVCDGKEIFSGNSATSTTFSPDSQHLAFVATDRLGGNHFVVCDGRRLPGWGGPYGGNQPVFSPDSQRLLYWAGRKGKYFFIQAVLQKNKWVVPRGQDKGPSYEGYVSHTWGRAFSPDSKHLACIARAGGKSVMVLDGKVVSTFDQIGSLRFSPDSKRLAYNARRGNKQFLVCDGQEGPAFEHIDSPKPFYAFSPDSKHLAYIGWRNINWMRDGRGYNLDGAKWQVVCDGRVGPAITSPDRRRLPHRWFYTQVPVFSPDSKHLAWRCWRGDKQFIVIDGIEGPKHAFLRIPRKPHVRAPAKAVAGGTNYPVTDRLRYVVGDGKRAWLVEVDWPPLGPEGPRGPEGKDLDWTHGLKPVEP